MRKKVMRMRPLHGTLLSIPSTLCTHNPEYARKILWSSARFVPGVLFSTIITVVLLALETLLVLHGGSRVAVIVGLGLTVFHASYVVNTAMQAKIALSDLDRCLRGRPPVRLTPDLMARALRAARPRRSNLGLISKILTIGTPFFPIAAWAVGEIIELTAPEIREQLANLSEDDHRRKDTKRSKAVERAVVRTSNRIVLSNARTVLAPGF
jgi:hypothetical protein